MTRLGLLVGRGRSETLSVDLSPRGLRSLRGRHQVGVSQTRLSPTRLSRSRTVVPARLGLRYRRDGKAISAKRRRGAIGRNARVVAIREDCGRCRADGTMRRHTHCGIELAVACVRSGRRSGRLRLNRRKVESTRRTSGRLAYINLLQIVKKELLLAGQRGGTLSAGGAGEIEIIVELRRGRRLWRGIKVERCAAIQLSLQVLCVGRLYQYSSQR